MNRSGWSYAFARMISTARRRVQTVSRLPGCSSGFAGAGSRRAPSQGTVQRTMLGHKAKSKAKSWALSTRRTHSTVRRKLFKNLELFSFFICKVCGGWWISILITYMIGCRVIDWEGDWEAWCSPSKHLKVFYRYGCPIFATTNEPFQKVMGFGTPLDTFSPSHLRLREVW